MIIHYWELNAENKFSISKLAIQNSQDFKIFGAFQLESALKLVLPRTINYINKTNPFRFIEGIDSTGELAQLVKDTLLTIYNTNLTVEIA